MNSSALDHLYQEEIYRIDHPVTIIIPRPWHKILDSEKALLGKILGSVKLSIDTVLIRTIEQINPQTLSGISSGRVLVFGSSIAGGVRSYEVADHHGLQIILADDLSVLDDGKKKSLWLALKQMFGV